MEQFDLGEADYGSSWAIGLTAHKFKKVTFFRKPIVPVKFAKLLRATNCFSSRNMFISSRTGTTYRALFPDGSILAIKRLSKCELDKKQFKTEMKRLGLLKHPNLVPFLGFCLVEDEKFLIYKHFPNGTLASVLRNNSTVLEWPVRLKIAFGAATGLAWLHHACQPPIFHQNVNSSIILLDEDFNARIIDFGMARICTTSESNEASYVYNDVFGFGVVLLELATGYNRHKVADMSEQASIEHLVDWVKQLPDSGRIEEAIDKQLCRKGHDDDIVRFLRFGFNCVVSQPKDRWTMYEVYEALKSMSKQDDCCESEQSDELPLLFAKPRED